MKDVLIRYVFEHYSNKTKLIKYFCLEAVELGEFRDFVKSIRENYKLFSRDFSIGLSCLGGAPIYENDIVNIHDNSMEYFPFPIEEDGGENFIIKWRDEMKGYWLWHIQSDDWWMGDVNPFSYADDNEIKKIGNIYHNTELLERK